MELVIYSRQPHYDDHLRPIAEALGVAISRSMTPGPEPVLVAGYGDVLAARRVGRRVMLLNHGAGQTYNVDHPSYSGGGGRRDVVLFLEPGPHAAEATLQAQPDANVVQVGCAKLDRLHRTRRPRRNAKPVVAVTFHWRCKVAPETDTAFDYYRDALADLVACNEWTVLGHGHPLIQDELSTLWADLGVEFVPRLADVIERADVLVGDNTSALYEWASLDRPVVCLNAAHYRRDTHHGLRFWDAVPGIQCDDPADLVASVQDALLDPLEAKQARRHAVSRAYVACDGQATRRAVAAIERCLADLRDEPVDVTGPDDTIQVRRSVWRMLRNGVAVRTIDGDVMVVDRDLFHSRLSALGWTLVSPPAR
jgi:hypothetical protein